MSVRAAEEFLSARDGVLKKLIQKHGPYDLSPPAKVNVFSALVRSIGHQQLTGKAAETILGRLKIRLNDKVTPKSLLALTVEELRAVGLSNAKARSLIDLANKCLDNTVPSHRRLRSLSDEDIVEALCQVRGIGPWTGHMFLMSQMGRLDVLPTGDYGVRKGFTMAYKKRELVTPKALEKSAEKWRPYRSVASWYMWRVLD
jgi:DNA-3-methyladenine glycosylase II